MAVSSKRTSSLRKHLAAMDAETLREEMERILERFPEVKRFYLADLSGDTTGIVGTAKNQIERCFKTSTGKWRRARSSKLNAVVRDFEKISVFPEDVLALLAFRLEETAPYLNHFRPSASPLLDATIRIFEQVCEKSKDYQLDEKYRPLLEALISRFDDSQLRRQLNRRFYGSFSGKMTFQNPVKIILTRDGSPTLRTEAGVDYHSIHGAVQESRHVFIGAGLQIVLEKFGEKEAIRVFEMGFGTGLNAFLTALESAEKQREVAYFSIEKHPLPVQIWINLSYPKTAEEKELFTALHESGRDLQRRISPFFQLKKISGNLEDLDPSQCLHLIYFDAFAPEDHPAAWTEEIFRKLYDALLPGGLLVTYCSKGVVRRTLQSVGFRVEKLAGPPGKREMVRAWK